LSILFLNIFFTAKPLVILISFVKEMSKTVQIVFT